MSKTQSAGSGMRPKVGRTERSHPNTKPHDQRASTGGEAEGQTANLNGQQADQPSHKNTEAHEYDVGFARRWLGVAEDFAYALHVLGSAGDPKEVSALHGGLGCERDFFCASNELLQGDAAAILFGK